jgi:hypothetical protein
MSLEKINLASHRFKKGICLLRDKEFADDRGKDGKFSSFKIYNLIHKKIPLYLKRPW